MFQAYDIEKMPINVFDQGWKNRQYFVFCSVFCQKIFLVFLFCSVLWKFEIFVRTQNRTEHYCSEHECSVFFHPCSGRFTSFSKNLLHSNMTTWTLNLLLLCMKNNEEPSIFIMMLLNEKHKLFGAFYRISGKAKTLIPKIEFETLA